MACAAQRICHSRSSGRTAITRPLAAPSIFLRSVRDASCWAAGATQGCFAAYMKRNMGTPSDVPKGPSPPQTRDYCPNALSKRCVTWFLRRASVNWCLSGWPFGRAFSSGFRYWKCGGRSGWTGRRNSCETTSVLLRPFFQPGQWKEHSKMAYNKSKHLDAAQKYPHRGSCRRPSLKIPADPEK